MFACPNLYCTSVNYIDMPDPEFFSTCLDVATRRVAESETIDVDKVKKSTPVIFCSTLSKLDKKTEQEVPRSTMSDPRARRKFLMIDADFDPGDEERSELARTNIIHLAKEYNTPLVIYPTVSYPDKPRFRAVMFSKRPMSAANYHQGMLWFFDQLGMRPLDDGDLRINANRNAPVFVSQEQVDGIYSTLDNKDLKPLDNKLWSKYPKPKPKPTWTKAKEVLSPLGDSDVKYIEKELYRGARTMASTSIALKRNTIWKPIESLAGAVLDGSIELEVAEKTVRLFALCAGDENTERAWAEGNVDMLHENITELKNDKQRRDESVKPLYAYSEFIASLDLS